MRFLARFSSVRHPMEEPPWLPQRMVEAIEMILREGKRMPTFREDQMQKIRTWAAELEPLRKRWVEDMHPDVRKVIGHVHLPLLQRMLSYIGYIDKHYVDKLMQGRPMLGPCTPTAIFPKQSQPATISVDE